MVIGNEDEEQLISEVREIVLKHLSKMNGEQIKEIRSRMREI
jgi:hypothetical protein